jgi:hypothetical protein
MYKMWCYELQEQVVDVQGMDGPEVIYLEIALCTTPLPGNLVRPTLQPSRRPLHPLQIYQLERFVKPASIVRSQQLKTT